MSKETTIEDVLEKHKFYNEQKSYTVDSFCLYEAVKRAMQEWASLTPSNEKYWRERCEAAEEVIERFVVSPLHPDTSDNGKKIFAEWQELKSTPIPIQTPCALPLDNDQPFNTKTVIETLIWASEHLLHEKNYDGGSVKGIAYEEIERCVARAKDILTRLIQTPCVESEKEVERLKGLIKQRERSAHYSFYSHVSTMTDTQIENQFKERWQIFKTENNI